MEHQIDDIEIYKLAIGKFPTGVAVITSGYNGKLAGFTANSFVSVSLKPPIVSFCLSKNASSIKTFNLSSHFAINILAHNQQEIAYNFASSEIDKFYNQRYIIGETSSCPLLSGTVSYLECKKIHSHEYGDHCIFLGEVKSFSILSDESPMVYYAKKFTRL